MTLNVVILLSLHHDDRPCRHCVLFLRHSDHQCHHCGCLLVTMTLNVVIIYGVYVTVIASVIIMLYMLAFRHFDGTLPPYLSSFLCRYQPPRSLRSERLFKIPKTNFKTFGERSFGYIAPTVWNSLPADLRASPCLPDLSNLT